MFEGLSRITMERFVEYFVANIEVVGVDEATPEEAASLCLPLNVLIHGDHGTEPKPERVLLEMGSPSQYREARAYILAKLAEVAPQTGQGDAEEGGEVPKQPLPGITAPGAYD